MKRYVLDFNILEVDYCDGSFSEKILLNNTVEISEKQAKAEDNHKAVDQSMELATKILGSKHSLVTVLPL